MKKKSKFAVKFYVQWNCRILSRFRIESNWTWSKLIEPYPNFSNFLIFFCSIEQNSSSSSLEWIVFGSYWNPVRTSRNFYKKKLQNSQKFRVRLVFSSIRFGKRLKFVSFTEAVLRYYKYLLYDTISIF